MCLVSTDALTPRTRLPWEGPAETGRRGRRRRIVPLGEESGRGGCRGSPLSPCPLTPASSVALAGEATLPLCRSTMTTESVLKAEKSPTSINVLETASRRQARRWEGQFSVMLKNEMPLGLNLTCPAVSPMPWGKSLLRSESCSLGL